MNPSSGAASWPLRTKLLGAFAVVGLVTPLVAAIVGQSLLVHAILVDAHARMGSTLEPIVAELSSPDLLLHVTPLAGSNAADRKEVQADITEAQRSGSDTILVTTADGRVVFGRAALKKALDPLVSQILAGQPLPSRVYQVARVPTVVVGLPVCGGGVATTMAAPVCPDGAPIGVVMAMRPVRQLQESSRYEQAVVRWAWLGGGVLSLGLSLVLAEGIARPLRGMARAAEAISAGDFAQRVPPGPPDEVGQLAGAFNRMAERLDRLLAARRDLLAAVSHELRTPLTSIQGFVTALAERMVPPADTERTYSIIQEEIARLRRLIDDLFELSKLEAGQTRLRIQEVPVAELVQAAAERGRILAGPTGPQIAVDADPAVGRALVDPDRVVQVLGNLVQNALRFTPDNGRVTLRARDGGSIVRFEVEDTGAGIPDADQDRVFERFYTAEPSRSRPSAGTGLGLSIAREIVRTHGGTIGVRSAPGQGSCFWFELPRGPVSDLPGGMPAIRA